MKQVILLVAFLITMNCLFGQEVQPNQQVTTVQIQKQEEQIDQNAKSITLLTIAVSAMAGFISILLLYIKKMHSKQITLATKFVEAAKDFSASQDRLSDSISSSGQQVASAIDRNERTTDSLHKLILQKMT